MWEGSFDLFSFLFCPSLKKNFFIIFYFCIFSIFSCSFFVLWVVLRFPSPFGWCCLVSSFLLGGVAVFLLLLVGLSSFSSFGWCCLFTCLLLGGAALVSSPPKGVEGREHHAKGEEKRNTTRRRKRPSSTTQKEKTKDAKKN